MNHLIDTKTFFLSHSAMGNRANARRAAQNLARTTSGPIPTVSSGGTASNASQANAPGDSPQPDNAASQRSADPVIDVAYRFLRLSPSEEITRRMIDYYFDNVDWYSKCIHRPSFMADLEELLSLPQEVAARTIRPSFLCIHFMVMCLALHLCGSQETHQWGMDIPSANQLCDLLFAGSQQLLWASDFIGSHQLEHLQAVCLMSVYAYNVDEQADAAYALVGASIKIAQNLCLNRMDDPKFHEKERQRNMIVSAGSSNPANVGEGQQNVIERELSKRVWWYLVWLDWSHALSHGGSYCINPAHNKTNMPSNVDDDDLSPQGPLKVKPMEEYTSTSFTICRLRFLQVYRETIDILNLPGGMTYPQLLEMDKKLLNLLHNLPPYFQARIDDSKNWRYGDSTYDMELLSIQITAHNRLLRLHRPYLARGLADRNNLSRKRCVDSAFAILAILRHAKSHAPVLLKVWINIYYVFSGALVLFLDMCYDDTSSGAASKEADEKRNAIREILAICATARHLSAAAKNTQSLLQGLLDAEMELRQPQNNGNPSQMKAPKRKRAKSGDNAPQPSTPFVSLVERVLLDAAAKDSSSSTSSLGRSPSDAGMFEPPAKRHSTSFVRDRASTFAEPTHHGQSHMRHNSYQQKSAQTPGSNPSSPWGPPNASRSATTPGGAWSAAMHPSPATPSSYMTSPSLPGPSHDTSNHSGGQQAYHMAHHHQPGVQGHHHHHAAGQQAQPAATASGLSSLLDEDIFSGLLMNATMESSDWESALAFVAPTPQQQQQHQHQQQHQQQFHS